MTADIFDKRCILMKKKDIKHLHDQVSYQMYLYMLWP